MILLLVAVLIGLVHLCHYLRNREFYQLDLPGPFAWPFIGNASSFLGSSNEAIIKVMAYLTTNWPTPLRFWLGPKFCVLVTKPQDIQVALTSPHCLNRDGVYDFTRTYAGDGLIALKSEFRAMCLWCCCLEVLFCASLSAFSCNCCVGLNYWRCVFLNLVA